MFPNEGSMQSQTNLACFYTIKTVRSKDVRVTFEYFELNGVAGQCTDEYLQEIQVGQVCVCIRIRTITSETNLVNIFIF